MIVWVLLIGHLVASRTNSNVRKLLGQPTSVLHQYRDNIVMVKDPISNEISSTLVRAELSQVRDKSTRLF